MRLWDDGVLQKILDRIKQNGVGTSSKSMKKAMREERDRQKRKRRSPSWKEGWRRRRRKR